MVDNGDGRRESEGKAIRRDGRYQNEPWYIAVFHD